MDPLQTPPPPQPKKDYTLVVILSFTTLLGVLIAFFFYFQNQQLRKQIISTFPTSTPIAIASPTPTPDLATPSASASATPKTTYTCPVNGWVDCMPVLDSAKQKTCSTEAQTWYKANCPNFQGIAL